MQFNQIAYFLACCDTLNFTRAAELCHVSQPSLSAAIQKLELELGGALFNRKGRSVELTPLGQSMRIHFSRIEQARSAAKLAASNIVHSELNVINMGFMCTLSPRRLLSAIASFTESNTNSELLIHDVWKSKAEELLLSGALDCIVMAHTNELSDQFNVQRLAEEPMEVAVDEAHPFAKRDSIHLSELQQQHYVDRLRCEFREMFFEELGARDLQVRVVLRSEREDLIGESISQSVGLSIMPRSSAQNAGLKAIAIEDMNICRFISVVTVKDRELHPSVDQFVQYVSKAYDQV